MAGNTAGVAIQPNEHTVPERTPIVLLSRPQAQSEEFAARLHGVDVVISPVIKIVPRKFLGRVADYDALIFASQNAVCAVADLKPQGMRAICVGEKTARAAASLGMQAQAAGGNAQSLIETALSDGAIKKALFLRGEHSRGNVAEALNSAGLETDSVIVYNQITQPLSVQAQVILRGERRVIIPLFSPRSSEILSGEAARIGATAPLALIAISKAALDAWLGPVPIYTEIVARPNADSIAGSILRRISRWS